MEEFTIDDVINGIRRTVIGFLKVSYYLGVHITLKILLIIIEMFKIIEILVKKTVNFLMNELDVQDEILSKKEYEKSKKKTRKSNKKNG